MGNALCNTYGMTTAEFLEILKTGTPDEQRKAREAMAAQVIAAAANRTVTFGKAPKGGFTEADRVK